MIIQLQPQLLNHDVVRGVSLVIKTRILPSFCFKEAIRCRVNCKDETAYGLLYYTRRREKAKINQRKIIYMSSILHLVLG